MYTDNCRYLSCFTLIGQFKSAKAFNWLAMQHARTNVRFLWNFFESGHGKGEHDGAGACIKCANFSLFCNIYSGNSAHCERHNSARQF